MTAMRRTAMPWFDTSGIAPHIAKPTSVRNVGFKGFVGERDYAGLSRMWHEKEHGGFDEDLFDSVHPEPTHEEAEHQRIHGELPESHFMRHEQAYSDALDQQDRDDTPDIEDQHLHHFISEHAHDNHLWGKPQKVDLSRGVYATQSHVSQFHMNRHADGPQKSWHQEVHGYDEDPNDESAYLGNHHPMFVTHQGRLHATEGHHRVATALSRGENETQGLHYDLDKHPVGTEEDGKTPCEECQNHVNGTA